MGKRTTALVFCLLASACAPPLPAPKNPGQFAMRLRPPAKDWDHEETNVTLGQWNMSAMRLSHKAKQTGITVAFGSSKMGTPASLAAALRSLAEVVGETVGGLEVSPDGSRAAFSFEKKLASGPRKGMTVCLRAAHRPEILTIVNGHWPAGRDAEMRRAMNGLIKSLEIR